METMTPRVAPQLRLHRSLIDPALPGPDPMLPTFGWPVAPRWAWLQRQAQAHRSLLLNATRSALATSAAWFLASALGDPQPVVASIAALLTVQATVYRTVVKGVARVAGVVAGTGLAALLGGFGGLHLWTLIVAAGGAALIGRILGGSEVAAETAVTALTLMSITSHGPAVVIRLASSFVGALVGVLAGAVVLPTTHAGEAAYAVKDYADDIVDVLQQVADDLVDEDLLLLSAGWGNHVARLEHSRALADAALVEASESLRWNHRGAGRREAVEAYDEVAARLRRAANHTGHIIDTLRAAASEGVRHELATSPRFRTRFSNLLAVVADSVQALAAPLQERVARSNGYQPVTVAEVLHEARAGVRQLTDDVRRDLDDPTLFLLYGALLSAIDALMTELAGPDALAQLAHSAAAPQPRHAPEVLQSELA
jgi:uncharacterized membrane protein YgaE (UPF0421/DUF939 family)